MQDIYDLLMVLVQQAARSGLAEHLVHDAVAVVEKFDPKIAEKRAAAEAQAAQDEADRKEYEDFKRFRASGGAAASSIPSATAGGAASSAAPVVVS